MHCQRMYQTNPIKSNRDNIIKDELEEEALAIASITPHCNLLALIGVVPGGTTDPTLLVLSYCKWHIPVAVSNPQSNICSSIEDIYGNQQSCNFFSSPFILSLYYFDSTRQGENGSLKSVLVGGEIPLAEADLQRIALEIACGMAHLAAHHYVHRDLATRNVSACATRLAVVVVAHQH